MANPSKAKGTDGENRVKAYAIERGWPFADRLTQSGINDRGDIRLGDGVEFTIEVKAGQGALNNPHAHLRELREEMANNGHRYGAVIAKKPGSTKVGQDWVAMMPVAILFDLLDEFFKESVDVCKTCSHERSVHALVPNGDCWVNECPCDGYSA